jgi:serine/threonine protein kinase
MVRGYMKQIFEGLEYMHGKGIVHTDAKLENLAFDDVPYRPRKEFRYVV